MILSALKQRKDEQCEAGPQFKQWVFRNFKLVTIGAMDYIFSKESDTEVAKEDKIFDIIERRVTVNIFNFMIIKMLVFLCQLQYRKTCPKSGFYTEK